MYLRNADAFHKNWAKLFSVWLLMLDQKLDAAFQDPNKLIYENVVDVPAHLFFRRLKIVGRKSERSLVS